MNSRRLAFLLLMIASGGCGSRLETEYGRVSSESVNGTGVFSRLLAEKGHKVRVARRLTESVADRADVIVRFSPRPGAVDREEAEWYLYWQSLAPDRRLIYVCRDYDASVDYWTGVLADLEPTAKPSLKNRIERLRAEASAWWTELPPPYEHAANSSDWFGVDREGGSPTTITDLGGPWAEGIDTKNSLLLRHHCLHVNAEHVLLEGDGKALVVEWSWDEGSPANGPDRVLVLANAGFLLNAALVNPARRSLADRVVRWAGSPPRTVVFVEGDNLFGDREGQPTVWELFTRLPTLAWIGTHFAVLGLVAALASAMILGQPRPAPDPGADRPRAHAEALGALLSRTRDDPLALSILETYRRWRHPLN